MDGFEYIFRDKRCGPGHYVIRCNVDRNPPMGHPGVFVKPPLEDNIALDHFNSQGHACHDSSKEYSIDDIIREFAHQVTFNEGPVTVAKVKASNDKLQKYLEEKATGTGAHSLTIRNIRVGTDDSDDDNFRDEVRA